jgi:ETC complex I subunit conserved region
MVQDQGSGGTSNISRAPTRPPGWDLEADSNVVPVVHIYRPPPTPGRGGRGRFGKWTLEFERTVPLTIEPFLMGWTESADPFAPIKLEFPNLQSAIAFAEHHGWRYAVHDAPLPTRLSTRGAARYDVSDILARVQQIPRDIAEKTAT